MKRAYLIPVCLIVAGCIRAEVQRLDQEMRPARSPDSVAVYLEQPDQPYYVIATIQTRGKSIFDSFGDLRNRVVEEAARVGGDALILGPKETESTMLIMPNALIQSDVKELSAAVIVFDRHER